MTDLSSHLSIGYGTSRYAHECAYLSKNGLSLHVLCRFRHSRSCVIRPKPKPQPNRGRRQGNQQSNTTLAALFALVMILIDLRMAFPRRDASASTEIRDLESPIGADNGRNLDGADLSSGCIAA